MALDYLAFQRIIILIEASIVNGKITKITQVSNEEFLFIIRNNNQNYNLIISTHPNMSYINIMDKKPESNHITSNLLMLLRKHLENGKIISFKQLNEDRIAKLEVENKDDYFNNTTHNLFIELIGRASNMILTNSENKILDSLKKIPLEYSNLRTIQPGITYTTPEKPSVESMPYDLQNEMQLLKCDTKEIVKKIEKSDKIYIVFNEQNKSDFHFIPLTSFGKKILEYPWNIGLFEFYKNSLDNERHRQFTSEMDKLARNEIKKNEKKIKKLSEELNNAKDSIIYKEYGDLLLTYMQGQKIVTDKVKVYDEIENKEVIIPYNPLFDVYHNANLLYKKYQKSKVALVKISEQIDICNENIDYFNSVKYHLEKADYFVASQIKEELISQGFFRKYQKPQKNNKKNNKNKIKVYKPLQIKIGDTMICVGQNNLQNEYLTFKMAAKSHLFLHIQQGSGAHVVVMNDKVDDKLLKIAANIAAYYSSYGQSSTVAVNYTLVKNIKKIPGGKPGKVIINNQKTIYVDPDYNLFKDFILD